MANMANMANSSAAANNETVHGWLANEVCVSVDKAGNPLRMPWVMRGGVDTLHGRLRELEADDPAVVSWTLKGCKVFQEADNPNGSNVRRSRM